MTSKRFRQIAIVGCGPRSLAALEALAAETVASQKFYRVDVFDPDPWPGAGPNFAPDQSEVCLLNIPVAVADYPLPAGLGHYIDRFTDWVAADYQPYDFPARSYLGTYLHERFQALLKAAAGHLAITKIDSRVTGIARVGSSWHLTAESARFGPYDAVLLTQGQPATAPDPQMARWMAHGREKHVDVLHAYPANALMSAAHGWQGKNVAIRGLGLSTLDVVRMLTVGMGGAFIGDRYLPSGREPRKILPFSLDGKAPSAKPATMDLDASYEVTDGEADDFFDAVSRAMAGPPDDALAQICEGLLVPVARISAALGTCFKDDAIRGWLAQERHAPGSQDHPDAVAALKLDIAMAHGRIAPSVGYVVGQVWRKLQGALRNGFNAASPDAATAQAVVGFDDGLKRFSYGPPVAASEQLLSLIASGLVSLSVADDPDLILNETGWQLSEDDDETYATAMVDAVIPGSGLDRLEDPLITGCMSNGIVQSIGRDMGARIMSDGQVVDKAGLPVPGLAMLGRLTLGSVIATDGLSDCFGPATKQWAASVM